MGTPDFAVESLKSLQQAGNNILAVVTNIDKPRGRGNKVLGTPVKEYAIEHNIKIYQPFKVRDNVEFINEMEELKPDLFCVVAYGKILPQELLDIPKYGSVNVHGSLLPKYRGAAPIQWAILNGDKTTGVTTMFMEAGMDTGDMILKEEVQIGEYETTGELWERLSKIGAKLLVKTLKEIELEKKRKAEKIERQKERRLEGEEARRKKKAERRKIAKAKKKEELKKQQEIENEKKKIEKATRLEGIRKEQEKLKQLPQIKYGDFIIKKSTFKCIHNNHHTEDMAAAVNVIEKDGNIKLKKINVGYCKECNVFFVLESIYEELKKWYVPICKVSDVKTYYGSNGKYGMKLAQESILKQYGYNVSKTEDLSDTVRQKILAVLIDNHIVTKNDIISYLDFFVSQRRYQSKYEQAISKWEEDREFVTNYRLGEYTIYGVNAIYRR